MRLCFLSLHSYPFLAGKNLGYGGGAEIEQVRLANELIARGNEVDFVTYFEGSAPEETFGKIRIFKTYPREGRAMSNPLFKYIKVSSALEKSDSDVYFYEDGAPGVLPIFCKTNKKKFVYRIATDAVVLGKSLFREHNLAKNLADYLDIKSASAVIAQNEFQKRVLAKRFGVESALIPNGIPIPKVDCQKSDPPIVLWVGNISINKDPLSFVELAKSLPTFHFEMIGGKVHPYEELYDTVMDVIEGVGNLNYLGYVPNSEISKFYSKASILVNTSYIEGFPNTFLEAWAHYMPVISYRFNLGGLLRKNGLGFCSSTFKQLVADVSSLVQDCELRNKIGVNGRFFVENNYDLKKIANKYLAIFQQIHNR